MNEAILTEREVGALFQLSGWPDSFAGAAAPLMRALGLAGPGDFRLSQVAGGFASFRVAPERILVRAPDSESFRKAAAGLDLSLAPVLELTGSRRIFRISDSGGSGRISDSGGSGGGGAAEVLSRLAAVDFSDGAFPAGAFAQAECLGTGALFHRAAESDFDVYVSRSWAESFRDFAKTAGAGEAG